MTRIGSSLTRPRRFQPLHPSRYLVRASPGPLSESGLGLHGCGAGVGEAVRTGQPRDASESYPTRTGPPRWRRRLARHRRDERCGPAAALKTPWTRASCPGTGGKGCAARAGGGPAQRREAAQCPDAPQGHVAPGDSDTAAPCAPQQALPLPAACPRRPRMSESRQGPGPRVVVCIPGKPVDGSPSPQSESLIRVPYPCRRRAPSVPLRV